jgi:pimeloyl-ACP methyl ester carboxylesterase
MEKIVPAIRVSCFTILLLAFSLRAGAEEFANLICPPYYMVHYQGSANEGELKISANYTLWLPPGVKTLRGVLVHQHGCGPGDDRDARAAAGDLQWQALARKQECALLVPSYEQSDRKCHCRWWCYPQKGSGEKFIQALAELAKQSHHPELATVPWALWGHSGGAMWAGNMLLHYPKHIAAVWLRSSVPIYSAEPYLAEPIPQAALAVPVMCNLGTKEGVTVTTNWVAHMWPNVRAFFDESRGQGGLIGVAVDPNSEHDCGNSRYLAIPWFDVCLTARLPNEAGSAELKPMPTNDAWLAPLLGNRAQPAAEFKGDAKTAVWLPNERIAKAWSEYVQDGNVSDPTPPPPPRDVRVSPASELTWEADADLESGIAEFVIERNGKELARVPDRHSGYFVGRPTFQQIGYGDEPTPPLLDMRYTDKTAGWWREYTYAVRTVNTVGVKSKPTLAVAMAGSSDGGSDVFPSEIISKQWPKGPEITNSYGALKLDTKLLDACVGHYEFPSNILSPTESTLTIWREGGQLLAQPRSGNKTPGPLEIYPTSETNFCVKLDDSQLVFIKNDKGEVTAVIHRSFYSAVPDSIGKRIKE